MDSIQEKQRTTKYEGERRRNNRIRMEGRYDGEMRIVKRIRKKKLAEHTTKRASTKTCEEKQSGTLRFIYSFSPIDLLSSSLGNCQKRQVWECDVTSPFRKGGGDALIFLIVILSFYCWSVRHKSISHRKESKAEPPPLSPKEEQIPQIIDIILLLEKIHTMRQSMKNSYASDKL